MSYSHLSHEEREIIGEMRYAKRTLCQIADRLKRSQSTISRELRRNITKRPKAIYYSALQATKKARDRRAAAKNSVPKKMEDRRILRYVTSRLQREWSPEQIAGRIKLDRPDDPSQRISHPTIYRWLRQQKQAGGRLHMHLRQAHRQRRARYGSQTKRFHVTGRVSIDERPAVVEKRSRIGDWEGDLVEGKNRTSYLVTLVDRRSGYLLVRKVANKRSDVVRKASIAMLRKMPKEFRRTITFDNGTEFSDFKRIESGTGARIYFAHPYCSWERGTNENTNGLIRQYVRKGKDIRVLPTKALARAAARLNNRPRKRLGYQTPSEVLRK